MNDANKALTEVRSWLCNNLGSGDAGKVCGMLSVVSRRINELGTENDKLRELAKDMWRLLLATGNDELVLSIEVGGVVKEVIDADELAKTMRELGVEVKDG